MEVGASGVLRGAGKASGHRYEGPREQADASLRCASGALRRRLAVMNVARRYPRFRRLLASLAVSQAGDWLYNLALLAFVYERTHSSAWLGLTTAARVLPIVVCGPLGGGHRRPLRPPAADARLRRDPLRPHARAGARRRRGAAGRPRAGHRRPGHRCLERLHPVRGRHHAPPGRRRRPARRQRRALRDPAGVHRRRPRLRRDPAPARAAEPGLRHQRGHVRAVRARHRLDPRRRRSSPPAASPTRPRASCASCATAPAPCSTSPWRCA